MFYSRLTQLWDEPSRRGSKGQDSSIQTQIVWYMDTYILKHWQTMIISSPVSTVDITLLSWSWISTRAVSSAWQVQNRIYSHGEPLHPSRWSNYTIMIFLSILVGELEDPQDGFDWEVDMDEFWDSLCL